MPSHPDRVRRAQLPLGYQFGDAGNRPKALPASAHWAAAAGGMSDADWAVIEADERAHWNTIETED